MGGLGAGWKIRLRHICGSCRRVLVHPSYDPERQGTIGGNTQDDQCDDKSFFLHISTDWLYFFSGVIVFVPDGEEVMEGTNGEICGGGSATAGVGMITAGSMRSAVRLLVSLTSSAV